MAFHKQLKRLWHRHAELAELAKLRFESYEVAVEGKHGHIAGPGFGNSYADLVADNFQSHGHKWLPMVIKDLGLTCAIEILFLRYGSKGDVFNVGDLDGRLKTLFDALAIPKSESGVTPPEDDEATFALLEDDALISHVSVEGDELLEPTGDAPINEDSRVIITVTVRPLRANWRTLSFVAD